CSRARFAKMPVAAALDDSEDLLTVGGWLSAAFGCPANGAIDCFLHRVRSGCMGRAFVEDHGDIGAQLTLDLHGLFWTEEKERTVQMRSEFNSMRFDPAYFGQAEHLVPTAIRQDRVRPIDEGVQPPSRADNLHPRADA